MVDAKAAADATQKRFQQQFEQIAGAYKKSTAQDSTNLLLMGHVGSGKTRLAATGRKPVLIQSFDSGGTKHLKKQIEAGEVLADIRWEIGDIDEEGRPTNRYQKWRQATNDLIRSGFVAEKVGTFVLDGCTGLFEAIRTDISSKHNRPERALAIQDYQLIVNYASEILAKLCNLPCDFILTSHVRGFTEELTGRTEAEIHMGGEAARKYIPTQFDEIYCAVVKQAAGGPEFKVQTKPDGTYKLRTRIGSDTFEMFETPDLTALFKKAGRTYEDLPPFETV